ncbi:MAG: hypothetical protein GXY19_04835 [Phycisphaerae bacterium]|nr:hypothetical protein [Phycisphaerae bacterium]
MNADCRRIRDHISDAISDALPEADERALREHLDGCADCRRYAQSLAREHASLADHFARIDAGMAARRSQVLAAIEQPRLAVPSLRRRILRKVAVAAAILVAAGLGLRWIGLGTAAYGLTEALEHSQNADVIHIKGWHLRESVDSGELKRLPFEHWIDRRNGRYRDDYTIGYADSDPNRPLCMLEVFDGEYCMDTRGYSTDPATGRTTLSIEYAKLSPFQRRLKMHTMGAFPAFMKHLREVKGFTRTGREQIEGTATDVWEGEIVAPDETVPYTKLRIWLSPSTGRILRIRRWLNEKEDSVEWMLRQEAHTIEYDVLPPPDCFRTDPPDGYELVNTKATAVTRELGDYDGRSRFYTCVGFTLNDGSVILGWHANHLPQESQADVFANLRPAESLPQLPARVVALKPWPIEEEDTILAGYHLAWTAKRGKFYEWGLYVPDRKVPERNTFKYYKVISEYSGVEPRSFGGRPNLVAEEVTITSDVEFKTWVIGAMAELSDNSVAPAHVTYENVMTLARQIHSSLNP